MLLSDIYILETVDYNQFFNCRIYTSDAHLLYILKSLKQINQLKTDRLTEKITENFITKCSKHNV